MSIYNKVTLNGTVILDISSDTVDAAHLFSGYTAHNSAGNQIVGTVTTMTLPTSASSSSSGTSKATIGRSTSDQYINIPTGYNSTAQYYTISAVTYSTIRTGTSTPASSLGANGDVYIKTS